MSNDLLRECRQAFAHKLTWDEEQDIVRRIDAFLARNSPKARNRVAEEFRKAAGDATLPVVVSLPPDWLRAAADALSAPDRATLERAADVCEKMRPAGGRAWSTAQQACWAALTEAAQTILALADEPEQKVAWTGSISNERYGDTPPEPKRLPTVAEMRGILSEENTNAAPQGATISNNGRPENPTGTAQSPAVAAPEPQQEPVADEHLPWLQVWLDEKIVRATGVRREVLEDLQHELDARPSPQAAEQEPVAWDASVFKGSEGLRGLLDEQEFWDRQLYGTRLYYGAGGMDYLHRDVLRAAVDALAGPSPQAAESVSQWDGNCSLDPSRECETWQLCKRAKDCLRDDDPLDPLTKRAAKESP